MSGDECAKAKITADLTVYYDYDKNQQQINHSTCDLSKWGGSKTSGCNSVWSGNEGWIYTYANGKSDFCCTINQPPTPTVRPDFMTLMGNPTKTAHTDGPYYNGTINFYEVATPDGITFWYNQEPTKGTPIGQGEAGPLGWVSVEYSSFMGKPTVAGGHVGATLEDPWFNRSHDDILRDLPSSCSSAVQCNN